MSVTLPGYVVDALDGARNLLGDNIASCVGPSVICPHPFSKLIEPRRDSEMGTTVCWCLNVVSRPLVRFYSCCLLTEYPTGLCYGKQCVQRKNAVLAEFVI